MGEEEGGKGEGERGEGSEKQLVVLLLCTLVSRVHITPANGEAGWWTAAGTQRTCICSGVLDHTFSVMVCA